MFHKGVSAVLTVGLILSVAGCATKEQKRFKSFVKSHLARVQPLLKERNLTYWEATASGEQQLYDRYAQLELDLKKIYSNREEFGQLKEWKESGRVKDPLLARQLTLLFNSYLENQIDSTLMRQMVEISTAVEEKFNTFRGTIDDQKVSTKQIYEILRTETSWIKRKKAWEASKQVGRVVQPDLIRLVKLRNKAARQLGFDNYYTMALTLAEQNESDLIDLFGRLAETTEQPYRRLKAEVDSILAPRYGLTPEMMRPWGYNDPFFQEVPKVAEVSLDQFYKDEDVKGLAAKFYESIGLEVDDIIERSDLYEREGKYPHAYCTDIDREGDIRIMANLANDEYEMDTMLHELGHGVYDKYIDRSLPFLLRGPAHAFTTEAIALMFGRLAHNANWLYAMGLISPEQRDRIQPTIEKSQRIGQLVFARWCQVMFNFERALYTDPDGDLNTRWWDLKEKYQLIIRPENRNEPDWAAKIHFTSAPVYYHNYMLGELTASQFYTYIAKTVLKSQDPVVTAYFDHPEVGDYMKERIFQPGKRYDWNGLLRYATGEPLNPAHFGQQFIKGPSL
ncbi:MAG: M2 family metallopeptidase [bacterium]